MKINGNELLGFTDTYESRQYLKSLGYAEDEIHQAFAVEKYEEERKIAKEIVDDYQLGIGVGATDVDIAKIKSYLRSINPYDQQGKTKVSRPDIFELYENRNNF